MAYEGMIAEMITIRGDNNDPVSAYTARPMGPGTVSRRGTDPSPAGLG